MIKCKTAPKAVWLAGGEWQWAEESLLPADSGKQSQHPPSHKSGNTAVGADIFSPFFFFGHLKKNEVELSMRKTKLIVGKQTKSEN